jgi:hypothetical protein
MSASQGAERILDRILCAVGAVAFSQAPEFMQQYLQRLEGHLDEARLTLAGYSDAAAKSGMTVAQLAAAAASNPDPRIAGLGQVVRGASVRVDTLAAADSAIRGASVWTRPFVFASHVDFSIARATMSIYRPAVPTTEEGLIYAAAGIVVILAVYHFAIRRPIVLLATRARRARPAAA